MSSLQKRFCVFLSFVLNFSKIRRESSAEFVDGDTDDVRGATAAVDGTDVGNVNVSRRPRSLTQQSVASFSMFCSVDSEQSLPRTAPLATPEQDMSLLDSLPVDRNLIRESLDDVNIDVLDEEEVVMRVSGPYRVNSI